MKKKFFSIFLFVCILLCSVVPTVASDTNADSENLEPKMELMPVITNDCEPTIYYSSTGFSGQTYTYQESNGIVVLTQGIFTKTGGQSYYSNAFLSDLYSMNDFVSSLSESQINAWVAIRVLLPLADTLITPGEISMVLKIAGVDLGNQLSATVLLMTDWYNAEVSAKQNYLNY